MCSRVVASEWSASPPLKISAAALRDQSRCYAISRSKSASRPASTERPVAAPSSTLRLNCWSTGQLITKPYCNRAERDRQLGSCHQLVLPRGYDPRAMPRRIFGSTEARG